MIVDVANQLFSAMKAGDYAGVEAPVGLHRRRSG